MSDVSFDIDQVRIDVKDLRPDMIIARDVLTNAGTLLLPRDVILNGQNYDRLCSGKIRYVFIKIFSISYDKPKFADGTGDTIAEAPFLSPHSVASANKDSIVQSRKPIRATKEFKEFEATIDAKAEELKHCLISIGNGAEINLDQLYSMTSDIFDKAKYKSDIITNLNFLKNKDEYTYAHSTNVALLAHLFGIWLGLEKEELVILTAAGSLHDLGKTKIPDRILTKKGKLTTEEFEIIKTHTISGYRLLENQDINDEIKYAALMHHERIDGTGYPLGLKADKLRRFSKIIALCDIYDAMTANRVYRDKICPFEVIKQFEQSQFGKVDTELLFVFLGNIAYTYLGSSAKLSDGRVSEVVFINSKNFSRPMVRIGNDILNLSEEKDLTILEIV